MRKQTEHDKLANLKRAAALSAWQERMKFTKEQAAEALGLGRSTYYRMLGGSPVDLRTLLACAAIEHGLAHIG